MSHFVAPVHPNAVRGRPDAAKNRCSPNRPRGDFRLTRACECTNLRLVGRARLRGPRRPSSLVCRKLRKFLRLSDQAVKIQSKLKKGLEPVYMSEICPF